MSIRKLICICILLIGLFITGCKNIELGNSAELPFNMFDNQEDNVNNLINKEGLTIKDRYLPIEGYLRVEYEEGSFAEFLRNQKLKPYGEKVLYYDGREKSPKGVYDSVFDVDIGNRDLHQCADAIILLRAEYLYSQELYDEISFNFVSGFKAEYDMWMKGYRIDVQGNNAEYYLVAEPSNTYEDFRKYMDMVFAYSGTLSLENELISVSIDNMNIGDVFIVGGSPGHAVIVVDMAVNSSGEKTFLLAQSYMPAQQTQLLINPMDDDISPWYSLNGKEKLITPQWTFELDTLKSWNE
jgi:hypothetical protein